MAAAALLHGAAGRGGDGCFRLESAGVGIVRCVVCACHRQPLDSERRKINGFSRTSLFILQGAGEPLDVGLYWLWLQLYRETEVSRPYI